MLPSNLQDFLKSIYQNPYNENTLTINRVYFVEISGNLKPAKEIKRILWLSRNDFEGKIYPLIDITQEAIIPDLIRLGYFLLL